MCSVLERHSPVGRLALAMQHVGRVTTGRARVRGEGPGLLHRRPSQERHDRPVRDAEPASAGLHVRHQGAALSRQRHAFTLPAAARSGGFPQTLEEYLSLFTAAAAGQRVGEASPVVPVLAHRGAGRSHSCSRQHASSRSSVSRRASCARCTCSCCAATSSRRRICARRSRWRRQRREGRRFRAAHTCRSCCSTPSMCATSSSCAAITSVFPPEQMLVLDLRGLSRATTDATLREVLRFLEVDEDYPIEEMNVKQTTHTMRSQQLDDLLHVGHAGSLAASRAPARAALKALAPPSCARALRTIRTPRRARHRRRRPMRQLMSELRRRFKPEVVRAERVPGPRPASRSGAIAELGRPPTSPSAPPPIDGARATVPMRTVVFHRTSSASRAGI